MRFAGTYRPFSSIEDFGKEPTAGSTGSRFKPPDVQADSIATPRRQPPPDA